MKPSTPERDEDVPDQEPESPPEPERPASKEIEVDLIREEIPVKVKDSKGRVTHYTLREMDGNDRDAFMNDLATRMKVSPLGKPTGMKDFTMFIPNLISRCLYDDAGKRVPAKLIQGWPARVQQKLFDEATKLSALLVKAEELEKND